MKMKVYKRFDFKLVMILFVLSFVLLVVFVLYLMILNI